MNTKKILALALALVMAFSLCACAGVSEEAATEQTGSTEATDSTTLLDTNNDGQIEFSTYEDVEVNEVNEHLDSWEACETGKWEAMFYPTEDPARAIQMTDFDLTPTAEELEAMKAEPAYGQTVAYLISDGCTSGPAVADTLGYFTEAGLTVEGVRGATDVEGLGTNQLQVAVGHAAKMSVPVSNGVDITFTGGAHIGCKSLYVLADSEYKTTADLKGTKISCPNGIGASDYNITAILLDGDGIHYANDVELVQVESSACVTAMENGEISAALLSDSYAYGMVKDGKLRCVRSLLDSDFAQYNCCVIAMNGTYVKENPVHAKKVTQAIQKAHSWIRDNGGEATDWMLEQKFNNGDRDMNIMLNNSMQFGLSQEMTEKTLKQYIENYIRLGLINTYDNADELMEILWTPVL